MSGEDIPGRRTLSFEAWKTFLRIDCIALDKLTAFDYLGENVLRILYENGVEPTVEAITKDGLNGKESTTSPQN
jgi:hypothetical protein